MNEKEHDRQQGARKTGILIAGICLAIVVTLTLNEEEKDTLELSDSAKAALIVESIATQQDNGRHSIQHPQPVKVDNPSIIIAGVGTDEISVGANESTFLTHYPESTSKTFEDSPNGRYLISQENGISVYIENGFIKNVFFYFLHPEEKQFPGETSKGINVFSRPEDVLSIYGKPTYDDEYLYRLSPKIHERSIEYDSKGITFTFHDDSLVDIRTHKPILPSSEEAVTTTSTSVPTIEHEYITTSIFQDSYRCAAQETVGFNHSADGHHLKEFTPEQEFILTHITKVPEDVVAEMLGDEIVTSQGSNSARLKEDFERSYIKRETFGSFLETEKHSYFIRERGESANNALAYLADCEANKSSSSTIIDCYLNSPDQTFRFMVETGRFTYSYAGTWWDEFRPNSHGDSSFFSFGVCQVMNKNME